MASTWITRPHVVDKSILCNKGCLCSCEFGSSGACIFCVWSAYRNLTELGCLTRCWNHLFSGSATRRTDQLHRWANYHADVVWPITDGEAGPQSQGAACGIQYACIKCRSHIRALLRGASKNAINVLPAQQRVTRRTCERHSWNTLSCYRSRSNAARRVCVNGP